jgi:uncharacterized protein YciI/uncharacterized protein YndB with AHSA1/START domain
MAALALLTPTRPGLLDAPTADEAAALAGHLTHLQRLVAEGRVLTAGPCEDGSLGVVVFPKDDEAAARELMAEDPAVAAGLFQVEVRPWRMSLLGSGLTDRSGLRGPETTTRIVGLHRRFVGESPASPSSLEAPSEPLGATPIRQTGPRHGTGRDWTGFVQAVHVRATPAEAWAMFASPSGMVRWFTSAAETTRSGRTIADDEPFEAGDRIRFVWVVPAPEDRRTETMPTVEMPEVDEVLAVEPGRRLRHAWYEDKGWIEYRVLEHRDRGRVTIELEQRMDPANGFALLEEAFIGCRPGWAFYLANLKAVLEHGPDVDLRDPRPDRRDLINV